MADQILAQIPRRRKLPSQERLRELFIYEPDTGRLTNRITRGRLKAGALAGCLTERGYRRVEIEGRPFYGHRIAWAMMTGEWPPSVDHIDCDKANLRWVNLRLATKSQNGANRRKPDIKFGSTSKMKGVTSDRERGKWKAQIHTFGRGIFIGRFDSEEDAHAAYAAKARELFGEFARAE